MCSLVIRFEIFKSVTRKASAHSLQLADMAVSLKDVVEAMVKNEELKEETVAAKTKALEATPVSDKASIRSRVGSFVNATSMQLLFTVLLFLTSATSATLAVLPVRTTYVTVMILKGALRAFASFTTTFFVLEILSQIYVQGLRFFKHPGCILDLIITGLTVYSQSVTNSLIKPSHIHALFFLRYWRLVAIVVRIIANVEAAHDATIAKLAESQTVNKKLQAQLRFMEDRRGNDAQNRSDVEALCAEYKNEIDTWMAALQLAAEDVAKGGGGDGTGRATLDVVKVKVETNVDAGDADYVPIATTVEE